MESFAQRHTGELILLGLAGCSAFSYFTVQDISSANRVEREYREENNIFNEMDKLNRQIEDLEGRVSIDDSKRKEYISRINERNKMLVTIEVHNGFIRDYRRPYLRAAGIDIFAGAVCAASAFCGLKRLPRRSQLQPLYQESLQY